MQNPKIATVLGAIVIAVIAFFIGRLTVRPLDGNPVGFHLHGGAVIDQKAVSLSSCSSSTPCNLKFDIYFNDSAAPSTAASCGSSSSCFSFHNVPKDALKTQMTVTIDEAASSSGYSGNVYASGAVLGS
jgi:alkaline phosphatase